MRILVAVVSPTEHSTLNFACGMRELQDRLLSLQDMHITMCAVNTLQNALRVATKAEEKCDVLVAIHSTLGFSASFVLRALDCPADFVAGIYPLPLVDWDRIAEHPEDDARETTRCKGCVYNLDPTAVTVAPHGYLKTPRIELKAVVLKRPALDALAPLAEARDEPSDDTICQAWVGTGSDIWADLDAQCSNFGLFPYNGSIGARVFNGQ